MKKIHPETKLLKFRIGDIANGIETSEEIIEATSYVKALEMLVESANLYCAPIEDKDPMSNRRHAYGKKIKS